MSANVGLSTPRGSGTSGYVQRNLSAIKHRDRKEPYPRDFDQLKHRQRQPDQKILAHDRAREIEVKVFELRDQLEDEGVDEEEIEAQTDALRTKLAKADAVRGNPAKGLKPHQVHDLAAAKIQESERLRKALGISEDYEEGSHWKRQEDRAKATTKEEERPEHHSERAPKQESRPLKSARGQRRESDASASSEASYSDGSRSRSSR